MGARFNEFNCAAQCKKCNAFEQGRDAEFERFILKKYGENIRNLLKSCERNFVKYTEFEITQLAKVYQEKAIELAKKKGLYL